MTAEPGVAAAPAAARIPAERTHRGEMAAGHRGRSGRYDAWHEEALVLAWIVATAAPGS